MRVKPLATVAIAALAVTAFAACSDDDDDNGTVPGGGTEAPSDTGTATTISIPTT
jgi:hypothetical protein